MRAPSSSLLWIGAGAFLLGSAWVWRERHAPIKAPLSSAAPSSDPRAVALLREALNVQLSRAYTARCQTETRSGETVMRSVSTLTHSPSTLDLHVDSGDGQGLRAGYSERWAWRVASSAPMRAVSEFDAPAPQQAQRRFVRLLQNYRVRFLPLKGATMPTIELAPRVLAPGAQGPRRALLIQPGTNLIVGTINWNSSGRIVSRSTLSNVKWLPKPQAGVKPELIVEVSKTQRDGWLAQEVGSSAAALANVRKLSGYEAPTPAYLPAGFALENAGVHRCPIDGDAWAVTRYTDGLNTLTLFGGNCSLISRPVPSGDWGTGRMAERASSPGQRVIAVGDLPQPVLQRVVDSVP